jgi:hypothetical protein
MADDYQKSEDRITLALDYIAGKPKSNLAALARQY